MRWLLAGSTLLSGACGQSTSSNFRDPGETVGAAGTAGELPGSGGTGGSGDSGAGGTSRGGAGNIAGNFGVAGEENRAGNGGAIGGSAGANQAAGNAGSGGGAGKPPLPQPECEEGVAVSPQVRRLNGEQYDRTIRDLLGVTELGAMGPPSQSLEPDSQSTLLTEVETQAYRNAATLIAEQVMADATKRARFFACIPEDLDDPCWHETIVAFGRRALRRPPTDREVTSLESLFPETGTVDEVGAALLTAFLISPPFLLRSESDGRLDAQGHVTLSAYEQAARLSYALWGSTPDEELDRAADAGELSTEEQILAQAERMLASDKAREQVASFHRHYLRPPFWTPTAHDSAIFPQFNAGAASVAFEEVERFFDAVAFDEDGTFQDLLTSPLAFVNADTAPIYGLDANDYGAELEPVRLDRSQRPGFLTRFGFLSSFSNYATTSPIRRGSFISIFVLGIDLEPEDPVARPTPPPEMYPTQRAATVALTAQPTCAGCHAVYIDPPGFVLESFDAIGAWQTHERSSGVPIDSVANVTIDEVPVTVTDPADLMRKLADSNEAQRAYAESWLSFAYERPLDPLDSCTIDRLQYRMAQGNYGILELVRDLTQTLPFQRRAASSTQ